MSKSPFSLWQRIKQLLSANNRPISSNTVSIPKGTPTSDDSSELGHIETKLDLSKPDLSKLDKPKFTASTTNAAFDEAVSPMIVTYDDKSAVDKGQLDAIFSSITEVQTETVTPISAQDIETLLENMGYYFVYHPVREDDEQHIHHFTMQVSDKDHEWGCMIRYFGEQQLLAVYSILPFSVSKPYRAEMLTVLTYLNYDLIIGNLELDLADGELRFKTSLDLEVTGVNELVLSYLLQSNFSIISRLYETLEAVVNRQQPTSDIQEAIDLLTATQQSKTFYLMSEAIQ